MRKRVLLVYRPTDRPFMEMLADHLNALNFEVVLDIGPSPTVQGALDQVEFADRVVVALTEDTLPSGGLIQCARRAGIQAKLVVVMLHPQKPRLDELLPIVDMASWRGDTQSADLLSLLRWLKSDLPKNYLPIFLRDTADGSDSLAQSDRAPTYAQGPVITSEPQPAEAYRPEPGADLITGRIPTNAVEVMARFRIVQQNNTARAEGDGPAATPTPRRIVAASPKTVEALLFDTEANAGTVAQAGFGYTSKQRRADPLRMAVRAPHQVQPAQSFLIQVWLFRGGQKGVVAKLAKQADSLSRDRGTRKLGRASRGAEFKITLDAAGLEAKETTCFENWTGEALSAQFRVAAPPSPSAMRYAPVVRVSLDGVPLARHTLTVTAHPKRKDGRAANQTIQPYRRAFLSYSSSDRSTVLLQAQALRAAHVEVFQDLLDLMPGERWEKRLYEKIATADLFMLFWSKDAAASEWVLKEAEYALNCQRNSAKALPEIIPIILDGPPAPPAPVSLSHLHFDDPVRSIIAAREMGRA